MTTQEALEEQKKLRLSDIALSLENYYANRENSTTTKYFEYKNSKYPIMNIIKVAIDISNQKAGKELINSKAYDNIQACIKTLEYHLCIDIKW